ncbi:MAG: succinate dehydrogenase assembly factor 2 [Alphaproteobacteria bacterium]|nr:succinate dehydrogenase assembly factor 2 [Alphaproteobacteria bacterium]
MASDDAIRRKRLLFRCWHRGTREMDLMLGRFATRNLSTFDSGQLDRFERLLENSDPDLYNWITGRESPPPAEASDVLHLLINFKFSE